MHITRWRKFTEEETIADLYAWVKQLLEDAGWAKVDEWASGDYTFYCYSSDSEEDDGRLAEYVKLWRDATYVYIQPYGGWKTATHAGNCGTAIYCWILFQTTTPYYAYVSKNLTLIIPYKEAGEYNKQLLFGHVGKRLYAQPIAKLQEAAAAGDNAWLTVDNVVKFHTQQSYQIFGDAMTTRARHQLTVTEIDTAANRLKVANLPVDYGAGSIIGHTPSSFGNALGYGGMQAYWGLTCDLGTTGEDAGAYTVAMSSLATISTAPDNRLGYKSGVSTGLYVLQPYIFKDPNGAYGAVTDDWMLVPPAGAHQDVFISYSTPYPETGTATSGGATTLTCTGKEWAENEWQNKIVFIQGGTGLGQTRKVISNTADTLTVSTWETNPSNDSVFYIVDRAYRRINLFAGTAVLNSIACREEF